MEYWKYCKMNWWVFFFTSWIRWKIYLQEFSFLWIYKIEGKYISIKIPKCLLLYLWFFYNKKYSVVTKNLLVSKRKMQVRKILCFLMINFTGYYKIFNGI